MVYIHLILAESSFGVLYNCSEQYISSSHNSVSSAFILHVYYLSDSSDNILELAGFNM